MNVFSEFIMRHARRWPERTALVYEGQRYDYGTLYGRSASLGVALRRRGLLPQDRVAMLAMNCPAWVELGWATHIEAFILATVNFRLAPPEITYIVNDSAPRAFIFEAQYTPIVEAIRADLASVELFVCLGDAPDWAISYEMLIAEGADMPPPSAMPAPADAATLIYTSGTTGRPKGVVKSQAAMLAMFRGNAFNLGMRPGDCILIAMPMYHVGAMSEAAAMFYTGGTVVLHRQFDPAGTLADIAQERVTHIHMAPTMIQALIDQPAIEQWDVSPLKVFNYAAAPMPVTLLRRAIERFGNIFVDIYGLTEVGGTILHPHQHFLEGTPEQVNRLGSVGQSTPGTELRIVDEAGKDCPTGVPGEIIIRSEMMMTEYWNNSVATIETLRDGWVHTGDVGYLDEKEYLFLVDRKKDMIISGGENIYCREVEEALMQHADVLDVAVIGVPNDYWGEVVHAVVIRKPAASLSEADLIAFSATQIARYKRPKSVEFVDELPRLPSGKVAKPELRERHRQQLRVVGS
jgi:acyl-CoA synthetase (AMP-forming)/AMP-acid ligase II